VRLFLEYLGKEEEAEYPVILSKSESIPLRRRFVPGYSAALESDIAFITSAKRRKHRGESTPYVDLERRSPPS
jgi:hypothetical protein